MSIKRGLILFIAVLGLSGCKMKPVDTAGVEHSGMVQGIEESGSQTISEHDPVMARQGNESISLYELMVSNMAYSEENGCIFGDGARLSNVLTDIAEDLPLAAWGDDFEVRIPQELRFYYIDIFDERYEAVNRYFPDSDTGNDGLTSTETCMNYMKELPRGTYYVSIAVVEEGEYVESEHQNEYTVYEYAFRLDKNIPPYTYSGDDIYMKGICEYFCELSEDEREWQKEYAVSEGKGTDIIYIPTPVIMKTEAVGDKVFIYGRFWGMWYALDGTNLFCISGGENAGRLEMTGEKGVFQVTGFEKLRDGSYYGEDWKRLCGDDRELYERFFTKEEREDRREVIRREMILQYAQDHGLDIETYQDFGWEPVRLHR